MRWQIAVYFCFIFFMATDISNAMGIIMRIQQMKQQAREGYQPGQQQQQQQGGQQAPSAQPNYQQSVDERNQAIAQAILDAHNKAVTTGNQEIQSSQTQQQTLPSSALVAPVPQVAQQNSSSQTSSSQAQDVVDLSDVWKKLDKKSTVWSLLIDDQAKLLTVSEYLGRFQKEGVTIEDPPMQYVQMLDQVTTQNPQMLQKPFGELLQILAIINYDFDNGMDKDALAKAILGEAGYEANKRRFTQRAQPQAPPSQ